MWATRALATSVVMVAVTVGGVARAASPGAQAHPATTVDVAGDPPPTTIAGPVAAAAPSGAAAPVGSTESPGPADPDGGDAQLVDVGAPPVPEHWPMTPTPTTMPPVVVDPSTMFPGATLPADVAPGRSGVGSAPTGAVALGEAPVPVAGAAPTATTDSELPPTDSASRPQVLQPSAAAVLPATR